MSEPETPPKLFVGILFEPSGTMKVHPEIDKHYVKGDCLCVELMDNPTRSWWSKVALFWRKYPVVLHYPLRHVFMYVTPHEDHAGSTQELEGETVDVQG